MKLRTLKNWLSSEGSATLDKEVTLLIDGEVLKLPETVDNTALVDVPTVPVSGNTLVPYIVKDGDAFFKCKKLDKFMTGHKGFIAGGCFKNIFQNQKIRDVDIFFESINDWQEAYNYYKGNDGEFTWKYENANAVGFRHIKSGTVVEIVRNRFLPCEEMIRKFDFTIAKFAYFKETSNDQTEYKFIYHPDFFEHLTLKKLVMDDTSMFPVNSFERSYKYQRYGFGMCKETKEKMINLLQGVDTTDLSSSLYFGFD